MKIGIELRQIQSAVSGGIAPQVQGIVEHAIRANPDHEFFIFATIFNRSLIKADSSNVHYFTLPLDDGYWTQLEQKLLERGIDVLFRTYPGVHLKNYPIAKQVVLIPDMQHEEFPEFFDSYALTARRTAFKFVLNGAGAIGTNTEYSKKTIVDFPQTKCKDIFFIPPAAQTFPSAEDMRITDSFRALINDIGPYFFYPANMWKHKNHKNILEALKLFNEKHEQKASLILTGHNEGWKELQSKYPDLPVTHLGYVDRGELRYLYEHAIALTFFSRYEGLGMPLLEAFTLGCPVICSNTTSLPEVGGDAVLECDPTDIAAMADLMQRVVDSPATRTELIKKGYGRTSIYTWEKSSENFIAALERVGLQYTKSIPKQEPLPESPLVSIVTPSYNQGEFLKRTIDSVLQQSYKNIELIVMDGGSTDDSVDILKSYGDAIYWESKPDKGQTDAINQGFAISKGQIRGYLNSDDTLLPGSIETIVKYFQDNPGCDMVYGDANYIDKEDNITGKYKTAEYSFDRLMFDCCVCQPAAFWRTSIAEWVGPFNDKLDYVMDYDYWLRIDRSGGKIHFLPVFLANSRLYAETKTLSSREKIYKEIFKVTKRHGGHVDFNYFIGLWHHRLLEKSPKLNAIFRRVPILWKVTAVAHHKWFHRKEYSQIALNNILHTFLNTKFKLKSNIHNVLDTLNLRKQNVSGFYNDGWFGKEVSVKSNNVKTMKELYFTGYPAENTVVDIFLGDQLLKNLRLEKGEKTKISFNGDSYSNTVKFVFSETQANNPERQISFNVVDTNLFLENDLH